MGGNPHRIRPGVCALSPSTCRIVSAAAVREPDLEGGVARRAQAARAERDELHQRRDAHVHLAALEPHALSSLSLLSSHRAATLITHSPLSLIAHRCALLPPLPSNAARSRGAAPVTTATTTAAGTAMSAFCIKRLSSCR
mgnify:CR=1 FL=1